MKINIILLAICLSLANVCFADVWVVYKDGEVYSMSEQNDAVVPQGYTVDILKGSISDLSLTRPMDEYKFIGKKFKVDSAKVKEKEDKQLDQEKKIELRKAKKQSAIDKLKALNFTDDEIDALIGKD
jgi:hypothetical protein